MRLTPGVHHGSFDTGRNIYVKRELNKGKIEILRGLGFREYRDPGFSQGRGITYMLRNYFGESNAHFVLWNLIYDKIRVYTDKLDYNLTRLPDIVFVSDDGRRVGVEVEATRKSMNDLQTKLLVLSKYDDYFFVVTNWKYLEHYKSYGETFTRKKVQDKIASYFQGDSIPEQKSEL